MPATTMATVGETIIKKVEDFGEFVRFAGLAAWWLFSGTRRWCRMSLLMPQFYSIGTRSTPVIMLVGAFIGMVLAVETYQQFAQIGAETRLGGVINISVVKQIGPVLAAVMLAGRVGGSVSAELGTMRVTEQLDALRAMGVDPVAYLVVPRVVACVVMIPLLTIVSDLLGIFGGYLVTVESYGVSAGDYWDFSARFITNYDVFTGLIKSIFFGAAIGMISCFKGFHCRSGAEGVGRAATESFVASFVAIIIANFFLAKMLNHIYVWVWGLEGPTAFSG